MKKAWAQRQKGFTIVELLIVIVIIGILAAITIVAYNGIQSRGNDSRRDSDMTQIKKALEMYKVDNGAYPAVCSADGSGCTVSNLASALSPKYIAAVPQDPKSPGTLYSYVRGGADSYGMLIYYESKAVCKTGVNVNTGWWGSSVPVC